MSETTAFKELSDIAPESETQWRNVQARAHRLRGNTADEAWATTHDIANQDIREHRIQGNSSGLCPRCLRRGYRYLLLYMGGKDRCGTCHWPEE